jgi:hypothetical protein
MWKLDHKKTNDYKRGSIWRGRRKEKVMG